MFAGIEPIGSMATKANSSKIWLVTSVDCGLRILSVVFDLRDGLEGSSTSS